MLLVVEPVPSRLKDLLNSIDADHLAVLRGQLVVGDLGHPAQLVADVLGHTADHPRMRFHIRQQNADLGHAGGVEHSIRPDHRQTQAGQIQYTQRTFALGDAELFAKPVIDSLKGSLQSGIHRGLIPEPAGLEAHRLTPAQLRWASSERG